MTGSDQKFEYFMERTKEDLDHIRGKVDKLWEFRILLLGASAVVSVIAASAFELIMTFMGHK